MRLLLTHAEALALPAGTYVVRVELWAVGSEEPASAAHSFLRLGAPAAPSGRATTGELLPPPSPPVGTAFLEVSSYCSRFRLVSSPALPVQVSACP